VPTDPHTPCIIGVAQRTVHPGNGPAPEPLVQWDEVCRAAADNSGAGQAVLGAADSLQIVYCQSWPYDDPPGRLSERLGIAPRHHLYSGIGGTTPQVLVQQAAEAILARQYDVAVITGAEALETVRQLKKAGERPAWSFRDPERKPFPFEAPFHPAEVAHNVFQAWLTFPIFDIARRAHLGIAPDDYRSALGRMMAPMTTVAATNPYAWFRSGRSADELTMATATNRMVGYPYTKTMVSIMDVDMAAAVIVASDEAAERLGVPAERRVYLRGWSYATDPVYVAEHDPLWASPAMTGTSTAALECAGVGIDDVAHLDLYSCFASSLNLARDALAIGDDDRRPLTVTGGLPFAGGAGSNYMMHSLAAMTEVLRRHPGDFGLVSGVGMHMTKHVFGVYSTTPGPVRPPDSAAVQRVAERRGPCPIAATHTGPATVVSYTVAHGRDGSPDWGLAICDVAGPESDHRTQSAPDEPPSPERRAGSTRCYARMEDPDLLAAVERAEWVGAAVELVPGADNVNLVKVP
jgi:acetyl-CoA C-acetyltransferase